MDLSADIPFAPDPPKRIWSPEQNCIFDAVRDPAANVLVQAVAGSGKTTTIVQAINYAPGSSLFLAFNKAIAQDIKSRNPPGDVRTLNALGHSLWQEWRPGAQLDAQKVAKLVKAQLGEGDYLRQHGYSIQRAVGLAKNNAMALDDEPVDAKELLGIFDNYLDTPAEELANCCAIAAKVLELSRADEETFDFDDQLWVPVRNGWSFPEYSNVFVDECQDLSPIQHLMLGKLQRRGARIVAVGDRHQAIYGFRGASADSMDELKNQFQMLEFPLSTTYRCATSIVEEAQRYCPTIYARENAPVGQVRQRTYDQGDPTEFGHTMILCRNNAPLFRSILWHVRQKIPCRVLSNFLDSFQGFLLSFKTQDSLKLLAKLENWKVKEIAAAKERRQRGKIYAIEDKFDTAKMFCLEFRTLDEILACIKRLAAGTSGPIFSTIHKAKGLEHEAVYILRPDLLPAVYATTEAQLKQEDNLSYVAITRAKESLTFGAPGI